MSRFVMPKRSTRIRFLLSTYARDCLLAIVMLGFVVVPSAFSQEGTPAPDDRVSRSFLFHPAATGILTVFSVEIDAGDSADLTVLIGNNGEIIQDIRTYIANVRTGPNGGMVADELGTPLNAVSEWLDYPEQILTLEPGDGIERTFRVTVPEGTPPGEYIAAVAGEHADDYDVAGSENFRQKLRYIAPIYITVPGEMSASFTFGNPTIEVTEQSTLIQIPITNDGDRHVKPVGEVTLRDSEKNIIATIPIAMQMVFAHESAMLAIGAPVGLPPGRYAIEGSFTDDKTGASASIQTTPVDATVATAPETAPFLFVNTKAKSAPSPDDVRFVTIDATIVNTGDPVAGVQLSLIAFLDGEEVERFPINQSLSLPTGETPITTRYIPATGFTSGEWTFELLLETVTPSGAAVVVARTMIEETIEVGG